MSAGPTIAVAVVISLPRLVAPSIKIIMALPSVFNSATKSCAFCGTNRIVWSTPSSKSNCVVDCVSKQAGCVRVYNVCPSAHSVGERVGEVVGPLVGEVVGRLVGSGSIGESVGIGEGDLVGVLVGDVVGPEVGDVVGLSVGCETVGSKVGGLSQ